VSAGALRQRVDVSQAGRRARQRVLGSLKAVVLAAVAAALAWYLAHRVLGHAQPFFAPIAAAISLSTSQIQRSRRIAQMVSGVLLGIVIGEGLHTLLGGSTAALGAIVLVTMIVSMAVGVGFFGDGMMFPNQAAASAILVATVHHQGTGAERGLDAVVGGGVALVLGVGLFPSHPLAVLQEAEQRVLEALATRLGELMRLLGDGREPGDDWTLESGLEIHNRLSALARARATARVSVRVAPRRWRLRAVVDAEDRRTARLDLLANAALSLMRAVSVRVAADGVPPPELQQPLRLLARLLGSLAESPRPWPPSLVQEIEAAAGETIEYAGTRGIDRDQVVAAILRATARDLIAVIEPSAK
jgi:uncharacterized membrane protein YgaE (UPF0421/DUF939 family)